MRWAMNVKQFVGNLNKNCWIVFLLWFLEERQLQPQAWAGLPGSSMKGSHLLLCLCSVTCWLSLMPAAGNKIFHFGPCRISMSVTEIRSGFTAIKANIVSIATGPWGAGDLCSQQFPKPCGAGASITTSSLPMQQARDPIRTLSILSHPQSLHKVKVGALTVPPLLWLILTSLLANTSYNECQFRRVWSVVVVPFLSSCETWALTERASQGG